MRRRISLGGRVRPSVRRSVRLSRVISRRVLGASCAVYPALFIKYHVYPRLFTYYEPSLTHALAYSPFMQQQLLEPHKLKRRSF